MPNKINYIYIYVNECVAKLDGNRINMIQAGQKPVANNRPSVTFPWALIAMLELRIRYIFGLDTVLYTANLFN